MADNQKKSSSSVKSKEEDPLGDLDIGNDFFSWKSMSIAEGDGLDFDLTPVSKGNKKTFNFDKADMDFNLDADFGKMSSFNLDMSDLDISPPLKKDAKPKEKSQESSSVKNKDKTDRFAFEFDFDELDNFSFDSTSRKKGTKAQKEEKKESSPNGSDCEDKEGYVHENETGSKSTSKDDPQKPSLPEVQVTFEMDFEPTREISPSNLAIDGITPEHSAAIDEGASDKVQEPLETTVPEEISNIVPSRRLVSPGQVDFDACTKNDVIVNLSSDYLPNNEPNGGNSLAVEKKVDSVDTNASASGGERDANMTLLADSTCDYSHTMSRNSQQHQVVAVLVNIDETGGNNSLVTESMSRSIDTNIASLEEQDANMIMVSGSTSVHEHPSKASHNHEVALSENINGGRTQDEIESHVECDRGRTELGQTNSHLENSCTAVAASGIPCETQSRRENKELSQEISESSVISQPADPLDKQIENINEPVINCSEPLTQSGKIECMVLKAPVQTTFSSSITKQTSFAQPSLVKGRNDDVTQSDGKLSLQCSKTLLRGIIPQNQSKKSCSDLKTYGEVSIADGLRNENKLNDSSAKQVKDMLKTKYAPRQGEICIKDLDTLSMETKSKAAESSGNPRMLASMLLNKNSPAQEHRTSAVEGGRNPSDLPGLKLSRLSINSTKSPILRESKSVGNSSQKSVLVSKTPSGIANFPEKYKQITSALSLKRTLQDDAADTSALHPSKRHSPSVATRRTFVETSDKCLDKKAPILNDDRIKSTAMNCQVTSFYTPHEVNTKGVEILSLTENDSNIKLAEACSKELDDLCDILRKKQDEAKELLVQAIVNSNKLLMLNHPQFEEKISFKFSTSIDYVGSIFTTHANPQRVALYY